MTKYRRLTIEELESLQTQFIRFLAAQSILASDWEKLKKEKSPLIDHLVNQFSNVVIEKTLHNVKYLDFRQSKMLRLFEIGENKIYMIALLLETNSNLDFYKEFTVKDILDEIKNHPEHIKIYSAEKSISEDNKYDEIYKMIENGSSIDPKGDLYNIIKKSLPK